MDLMANGATLASAAPKAGMFVPEAAFFITRPDVKRVLADIRTAYVLGNLQPVALEAAFDLIQNGDDKVRAKLAVSVLAFAEKIQAEESEAPPSIETLSPDELIAMASELRSQALTIEHDPQPVTPATLENALF